RRLLDRRRPDAGRVARTVESPLARLGGFGSVFIFFAAQVLENQHRHRQKMAKVAVVQTYPVPTGKKMSIIHSHHVSALQQTLQGWQAAPLLEHRRKQARERSEE